MIFGFFGINSGSHGLHGDDLLVVRRPHRAHHKEGRTALGMAGILQLLIAGNLKHMIDHRWQIVHANFMPTEVPELGCIRIESCVISGVAIATRIAQPNVIVVVGQQVGYRMARAETMVITWLGINHPDMKQTTHSPRLTLGPMTTKPAELSTSPCWSRKGWAPKFRIRCIVRM